MSSPDAFESLIERYAALMASAVRRVCGRRGRSLVPDVEQEIRLALWKRLRTGKPIRHPGSYIYKVALTTAAAVLRKQAPVREEGGERVHEAAESEPASRGLEPVERRRALEQALESLPGEQALALRAYLAGFNHREIARLCGWSESVARHRVYRAIDALRDAGGKD